jgi:peroxiredoxin
MLDLGTRAPDFELPDPSGKLYSLDDFSSAKAFVVAFICNHCPYVKHIREGLADFARDYADSDFAMVAISSNDVEKYPADSPAMMAREILDAGYTFPYLYDENQEAAKAYRAACTPDLYLFDEDRRLVYRGQFDGSRPGNGIPVTGKDLRTAVDRVLAGEEVDPEQISSIGCNIKWKEGNEPEYAHFGATS